MLYLNRRHSWFRVGVVCTFSLFRGKSRVWFAKLYIGNILVNNTGSYFCFVMYNIRSRTLVTLQVQFILPGIPVLFFS